MSVSYVAGAEEPDLTATWRDTEGAVINFATGWTFSLKLYKARRAPVLVKTTGIIGAATSPNLRVVWDADELDVEPGGYRLEIKATRAGSRDRFLQEHVLIRPSATGEVDE